MIGGSRPLTRSRNEPRAPVRSLTRAGLIDCLFRPCCRRQSAISIGQAENLPALAFSVRFRRYPPGLLIMALRCTIAASATHASSAPITSVASAQAFGLMPKAPRTVSATLTKSRQLAMPWRANIAKSGQAWRTMLNGNGRWGERFAFRFARRASALAFSKARFRF